MLEPVQNQPEVDGYIINGGNDALARIRSEEFARNNPELVRKPAAPTPSNETAMKEALEAQRNRFRGDV